MSQKLYEENNIRDIASAIREQNGTQDSYTVAQMGNAVRAIHTQPVLETLNVTENGNYLPSAGKEGFSSVSVNVDGEEAVIQPLSVTQNGTYNPPSGVDGYAPVTVNVSGSGDKRMYTETGLMLEFDGIDNTGNGHSSSTSIWKNLANPGQPDGNITDGVWNADELVLNGSSSFVDIVLAFRKYVNNLSKQTFEIVFKKKGIGVLSYSGVMGYGSGSSNDGYDISIRSSGRIAIQDFTTNTSRDTNTDNVVGTYYCITVVEDGSSKKVYINGVLDSTFSFITASLSTSEHWQIGRRRFNETSSSQAYLNGSVKHAAIYDRALTAEEVAYNYQYLRNRFNLQ